MSLLATDEAVPNVVTQNERKAPSSIPSSSSIETSNSRDDLVVTLPNLVGVLQLARDEKRLRSGSVYHEFVRLHAVHYNFFASDGLGNGEKKKVLDCYIKMIVTEYPQIKEDITAENPSGYVSFILFHFYCVAYTKCNVFFFLIYVFRDSSRMTFTIPQETCVVTEVEKKNG